MRIQKMSLGILFLFGIAMITLLSCFSSQVQAEQDGDFSYTILDGQAQVTGYTGSGGDITIPGSLGNVPVTSIGDDAFYQNPEDYKITKIYLPESVINIGNRSFCNNRGLTSIYLPQNLNSIGNDAFGCCTALTNIEIPESVTYLGNEAFYFSGLTSIHIPKNIKTIGVRTFYDCKKLTNVELSEGVSVIGELVFLNCTALKTVNLPESLTSIGYGAFECCSNLSSQINIQKNVTSVGKWAFLQCNNLTSVNISEGVTSLGDDAFAVTAIKSISIPESVTNIGVGCFSACGDLTNVNLPQSLTLIPKSCFSGCKSLTYISLPQSIKNIGDRAFGECYSLTRIDIPQSVTFIGKYAFGACGFLTNINLPQGMTEINENCFSGCSSLKNINIPQSVNYVAYGAFNGCTGLSRIQVNSTTTQIINTYPNDYPTIPKTVKIIGYDSSTAHVYANTYGNSFELIGSTSPPTSADETSIYELFNYKPNEFNQTLAKRAALYSMLAYDNYMCSNISLNEGFRDTGSRLGITTAGSTDIKADPTLLKTKLITEKFEGIQVYNYDDNDPNNVSFVIAQKTVYYNNEPRKLTVVIIRGTDGVEWQGNMDITGDNYEPNQTEHWSFNLAKNDVLEKLNTYLNQSVYNNSLVLVTGHSRGAAVANLVANELTDNKQEGKVGDVFAYTFATPNVTLNPDYTKKNIFNFCFEDDFVPQVPLQAWNYGKNGITFSASAEGASRENQTFKNETNDFVQHSDNSHDNGDFNLYETQHLIDYVKKRWQNNQFYYEWPSLTTNLLFARTNTLHNFFKNSVAPAAMNSNNPATNAMNIAKLTEEGSAYSDYGPIFEFFVKGKQFSQFIADNHQMYTYYSALNNGVFAGGGSNGGGSSGSGGGGGGATGWSLDSVNIGTTSTYALSTTSTSTPTNCNPTEIQKLKNFVSQGDNLQKLGWSLDDVSTWSGVFWSDEAENRVIRIDTSFKELSGSLDISGFLGLEQVDVSGNRITSINLAGCIALVSLDCSYNELTQLNAANILELKTLKCFWNNLETLNMDGSISLEKLDCRNNQLTALNITTNSLLTDLHCDGNNLTNLDVTANTILNTFGCEQNYLDVQSGSPMLKSIETIKNRENGWVSYESQKIPGIAVFNSGDVGKLNAFTNQGDNLTKLQWDLSKPQNCYGVEWSKVGSEYRLSRLSLDNSDLTGNLDLSGISTLRYLSCNNNQMNGINVSNCGNLNYLSCNHAGILSLDITGCLALTNLRCEENYLDVSDGTVLRNNINSILQNENNIVTYTTQKIDASIDQFNQTEYNILLNFGSSPVNSTLLNWKPDKPGEWTGITWELSEGQYRVKAITFGYQAVTGSLELSEFDKLTALDCMMTKLTAITMPNSIIEITPSMFYDCNDLTDVILPSGTITIGKEAFYHCTSLNTINMPKGIASIGEGAFAGCTSLISMILPETITDLGTYAFFGCTSLTTMQFNSATTIIADEASTIPNMATIIGYDPSTAKGYASKYGSSFEVIKPAATLQSITINIPANKLIYNMGEPLDITGLVVTGTYSDKSKKVENINLGNITGFDSSKAVAKQTVTITVSGKTAIYSVQIVAQTILGDVDSDGKVQAYDALMALQIATGKKVGTAQEMKAADVDISGSVKAFDALRILQFATGKITAF